MTRIQGLGCLLQPIRRWRGPQTGAPAYNLSDPAMPEAGQECHKEEAGQERVTLRSLLLPPTQRRPRPCDSPEPSRLVFRPHSGSPPLIAEHVAYPRDEAAVLHEMLA